VNIDDDDNDDENSSICATFIFRFYFLVLHPAARNITILNKAANGGALLSIVYIQRLESINMFWVLNLHCVLLRSD
jgi:hypothetical protein